MICAPLKKKTVFSLLKSLREAQKVVDIIEVWFDELGELNEEKLNKIFADKRLPFIYKCQRPENIEKILQKKIEFIDLDISTPAKVIKEIRKKSPKTLLIISFHDFNQTPPTKTLKNIAKKMKSKGADIIKIATQAKTFEDSIRMLSFLSELHAKGEKAICLCMGAKGEITRTAGHLLGNYLMYAPIKDSDKTAPGQIIVNKLKWLLK